MIRDPGNRYRTPLLATPHTFSVKVDTPWQDRPDLPSLNKKPFDRICHVLQGFNTYSPENPAPSQGIVLLGEAGTGKTHLLMRVARKLAQGNFVLFVPKPNNEEAVYLHTWSSIVQSLAEILPERSKTRSQLDDLLAHVFSAVLIPEFEKAGDQEQRWARRLKEDPLNLFGMLGEGKQRAENFRKIRERTLRYLKSKHTTLNETITHALITYVLAAEDRTRRIILTWLAGQGGIDETEARSLGLPIQWVELNDQSMQANYLQQRETQALEAIQTLGILSTYYQPLILAYDQLEGLRTRETLTRRWSEAVREIINFAPNYLVLVCVFPSLWETWKASNWIETSSAQRIGPRTFTLESFSPSHAEQLLEGQIGPNALILELPSSIYPFEQSDIQTLCAETRTPREFLLKAQDAFEEWLFQEDEPELPLTTAPEKPPKAGPPIPLPAPRSPARTIDVVLQQELVRLEKQAHQTLQRRVPNEEDLFGRVRDIVEVLLRDFSPRYRQAELRNRVMPFNIVVLHEGSTGLCLSVLNSTGNPLTARLRNLNQVAQQGEAFGQAIILRDGRVDPPTQGTVGERLLRSLKERGNIYLEADITEMSRVHAIYDAIVAIEQEDLQADGQKITLPNLVRYLRTSGYLQECKLFRLAAEQSHLFKALIHSDQVPLDGEV